MKTAVTGAGGMIGTALTELLETRGVDVFRATRDLTVQTESADVFFHLGWGGTSAAQRGDPTAQSANIAYTLKAVEFAKKLGCKKFVYAGSQAEINSANAYAISKNAAGALAAIACEQAGIEFIRTRIFSIYGRGDLPTTLMSYLIKAFAEGEIPALTKCEQIWDYMYVKDCALALILLAEQGKTGEIYNLGSGVERPLREFVEEIREAVNPQGQVNFGAKPYAPGQVMRLCADTTALVRDTGFKPQYSFIEGIKDML